MKVEIDYIYSEQCPAPWATTPDANCLCCDYLQNLTRKGLRIIVKCSYLEEAKTLFFPHEQ